MSSTAHVGSSGLGVRWIASAQPATRAVASAAFALLLIASAFFMLRPASAAGGAADGTYENDCCGELVIRDGQLILGNAKPVEFELKKDEAGFYLLPSTYVGTWEDRGFEVDGTRAPLKLRLDAAARAIRLPATHGSRLFARKEARVR